MTINGAIMQLVEMRENSMMPEFFKPYLDKVIETVSECEEPSSNTEIIHCRDCKHYYFADNRIPQEQRYVCDIGGEIWQPND